MGNTKTYYLEGELIAGTTLEQFRNAVYDGFHSTYCVADFVEEHGGYLGQTDKPDAGPYLVAAIHSYSMRGDYGPSEVAKLFKDLRMHRLDSDWSDVWVAYWENGEMTHQWTSEAPLKWKTTSASQSDGESSQQEPT
jgi:hypothetical protein